MSVFFFLFFLNQKDFGLDMTNASTYPTLELIRLGLIRLGLYTLPEHQTAGRESPNAY